MSLVNYGSSDESSGEEDTPKSHNMSRPKPDPKQRKVTQGNDGLQPPSNSAESVSYTSDDRPGTVDMKRGHAAKDEPIRKRSLLSNLPPPKSTKVTGFPVKHKTNKELPEVVSSTTIKKSFLSLPPPKKKSQTVKITLPSLPDPGSDDDEDNEPVAKKPATSKGVSGLLSMLPKPKSAMSSRILVPHTVSRKKPQPSIPRPKPQTKPAPQSTNTTVPSVIGTDYGSDDDIGEEGSSFFALDDKKVTILPEVSSSSIKQSSCPKSKTLPSSTVNTDLPKVDSVKPCDVMKTDVVLQESSSKVKAISTSSVSSSSSAPFSQSPSTSQINTNEPLTPNSTTDFESSNDIADAPLSFSKAYTSTATGYGQVTSSYYGNYDYSSNYYEEGQSSYEYNQPYQDVNKYQSVPDSTEGESSQFGNIQEDADEFRKFFGKKQSKEDINMISINADDQTAGSNTREALLKTISEEKQPMSYSKKKNSDLPSSQQRRKHQITYLAFQAKERELALKNQWSQNRMTRKQTQAKYGF